MEEVIASVFIRSSNYFNDLWVLRKLPEGPQGSNKRDKGTLALKLLESKPLSIDTQIEIRNLAQWIKDELHSEYNRMLPERAQKTMSVFELSVYSPTIEETWKKVASAV
jgi:hypothetical protein